jgi:uncharacterized protein (DUF2141 family)
MRASAVFSIWTLVLATGFALAPRVASALPAAAQANEVRIVVNGVRNQKGSVICSLWSSVNSADFTTVGTEFRKISVPIEGSKAVCEFKGLSAGAYAATVFHDENGNGKFDRLFGYPLEGYGFTNNVYPTLRAPSFDQCEVQYGGKGVLTLDQHDLPLIFGARARSGSRNPSATLFTARLVHELLPQRLHRRWLDAESSVFHGADAE